MRLTSMRREFQRQTSQTSLVLSATATPGGVRRRPAAQAGWKTEGNQMGDARRLRRHDVRK